MPAQPLTSALKCTVLKHLINGRDADFIATATGLTPTQVGEVKRDHGYPDVDKMSWALDILDKRTELHSTAPAARPARPAVPSPPPVRDLSRAHTHPLAAAPATATAPAQSADHPAVDVLALGRKSSLSRTRNLAEKITDLLADLERRIADEQEDRKAKAQAAAADAKRKARIAELEAEIAALRGTPASAARPTPTPLRTGAPGQHVCACGRTFDRRNAYTMHSRTCPTASNPTQGETA